MANNKTILVLEDDNPLMEGIRDMLELHGYQVLTAGNGVDGLKVLHRCETPPDLIVSDIMMPEMDGYRFLQAVREDSRWLDIPFIFLTAKGEKSDVRFGKSMGADDYVTKPFEAEDLVVAVDSKLKRHTQIIDVRDGQVAEIKRRILTILHHEFRTPLTYVVAYSDLLNQDVEALNADDMRQFLTGITSGADRLRRLVENFILLVELETGEAQHTFSWRKRTIKDVRGLMQAAIEQCEAFANENSVRVELCPPETPLPTFTGDQEYLKTMLARLIDNGIKFSNKPNSRVTVSASAAPGLIQFRVSDQGRGIPESEITHIFETFYQINRAKTEDQGAGAGLSIVRQIVAMHNGSVAVNSVVGQGSEFIVSLPVQQA